jgi:hypothetical protein
MHAARRKRRGLSPGFTRCLAVRARVAEAMAIGLLLVSVPRAAFAQSDGATSGPTSQEGTVVEVEPSDLILDLGAARGVSDGDFVEIWRPLHVRHPVTGRTLTDRFLIGRLRLVQVRPSLSLAVPEGSLSRPARPGDIIVPPLSAVVVAHKETPLVQPGPSAPPPPTPATPAPPAPPTPEQVEDAELGALFEGLRGADVPTRIRAYEQFATSHPKGRRTTFVLEEARAFRTLLTVNEQRETPVPITLPITAEVEPVPKIVAHEPWTIAVAVHRGGAATNQGQSGILGVVLHVRHKGAETYESQPMAPSGPAGAPSGDTEYWAATVPAESVEPPELRYFIEVVDAHGTAAAIGTASAPEEVAVQDTLPRAPSKAMGQAAIWTDYASFNAKAANDYIFQTEGYMGVRFGDVGIRALRTGFGVYRGEGGTVHDLDTLHLAPESVGLTYGYLETEFGLAKYVSIGVRGTVGLDNSGVQGGGFGFLRLGSDLGTNIWFGAEGLGGIGVRGITQFEWNAFPKWPIVLRTEVTDEPAGGDIGVRAIAQVGYRFAKHLVVSVRGSYQGRTIDHSGPGGGAAVAYAW